MKKQADKYLSKLMAHRLIDCGENAWLYGLDDEIYTNRNTLSDEVAALFGLLNINSLIIARPQKVLWSIIRELTHDSPSLISPCDCESLTFIHDIPVVDTLDAERIARALNRSKGCIVKDTGIVTTGTVSLEQAFVTFSSICFATFVKYFSDLINGMHGFACMPMKDPGRLDKAIKILSASEPAIAANPLAGDISHNEADIIQAMDAAGKAVVSTGLVDSFFGNISYRHGDSIYISQTGSSLDELPGCIDCVPLDGSSTCDLTSSSELMAHIRAYELTGDTAILHGHPRFSVIMSMFGHPMGFGETRFIGDVPVVAGEVGAGRHGLMHTLPEAMKRHHAAIVYGHGTFTSCKGSFREAFERLTSIEQMCFSACRQKLREAADD